MLLVLWKFHECVSIIFTSPFQLFLDYPFPLPAKLWVLFVIAFFLSQIMAILFCQNILGCVAFHWSLVSILWAILLEKTDSSFCRDKVATTFSTGGGLAVFYVWFLLLLLLFCCDCYYFYVWSCPAMSRHFSCSNPQPVSHTLFVPPLLQWYLSLRGRGDIIVPFRAEHSGIPYSVS